MPQGKNHILARRNLIKRLLQAVDSHRLVVVVSPMGYGKTTVAHQFAERDSRPSYFFSVPDDSQTADGLWDSLWKEMGRQGMTHAPILRRMGFPANPLHAQHAFELIASVPPALFIIDDYHHSVDPAMDAFIETAVRDGGIGNRRILLFSRSMPKMNLEEMEKRGIAVVYDQAFLAFSEAEAKEYFFLNDVTDGSVAENAWKYSEGWAAALWLCLHHSKNDGGVPPSGDIEALMETLVYFTYRRADRAMLMQLSVLDSFTVAEAEALTQGNDARRRLSRIMSRNAFIARDPVRNRYQFHRIFRTFLQKRLEADAELNVPSLYRKAAECHAARREYITAYRLLGKAGREEDLERLLELLASQGGETTRDCRWEEIRAIVQAIPWHIRLRRPIGYVAYLWLCACIGNEDFHPALLDEAEKRFNDAKKIPLDEKRRLAGELEYLRGFLAFNDNAAVTRHYKRAYTLLSGPSFLSYERTSWSLSCPYVSFICTNKSGSFHLPKDILAKHWQKLDALTGGASRGNQFVTAAEYHLERCELDVAKQQLDRIDPRLGQHKNPTTFLIASFSRARLLLARGKASEAVALLRDSAPRIEQTDMFEHIQCHDLALGYIQATLGRTEGLPRWLADGNVYDPPYGTAHVLAFSLTVYGKILLARGDYNGLANLVEGSSNGFGLFEIPLSVIHIRIFEAIIAKRRREPGKALESLRAALDISRPDGIVLAYAEYGDKILSLLHRLRRTIPDDPHLEKIIFWCKRDGRIPEGGKKYQRGILTPRENIIMRLAAKGRTTSSIARNQGISEATVKTILSHVYAKLDARNRSEAVNRFAALNDKNDPLPIPDNASAAKIKNYVLTSREQEIMRLVKQGKSNAAIASVLDISPHTVKYTLTMAYSKLHASNRVQAVHEFTKRYGQYGA